MNILNQSSISLFFIFHNVMRKDTLEDPYQEPGRLSSPGAVLSWNIGSHRLACISSRKATKRCFHLFFFCSLGHVAQAGHKLIMYQKKLALTPSSHLHLPMLGLQVYATHTWLSSNCYQWLRGHSVKYDHCGNHTGFKGSQKFFFVLLGLCYKVCKRKLLFKN